MLNADADMGAAVCDHIDGIGCWYRLQQCTSSAPAYGSTEYQVVTSRR